ncbi:MAG: lactate utilization protein B [Hydrotalea sp.]|nr:lactate utilization protein B [Hydrotalea sp.]
MSVENFSAAADKAIKNDGLQQRLAHITHEFINKRQAAVNAVPDWEAWRVAGKNIKQHAIEHLDIYLEEFEKNLTNAGGELHYCQTGEEAADKILRICQQHKAQLVVKSKSMVAEEINLNQHFAKNNIKLVETDLGDYIVQLRGDEPAHPIAPALHVGKAMVAETFRQEHKNLPRNRPLESIGDLMAEARGILRKDFLTADVGITGANFLVAESGSVVLVTNEGNGDLVSTLPPVHIVVTTIDKIVPTLYDASHLLRLLCRSATGQPITSYASFFTGNNQTQDGDGAIAFHVLLLNNNRTQLLADDLRPALSCIKCGACLNHCPVYQTVGGASYGGAQMGPIGSAIAPAISGIKRANDLVFASTLCGRCDDVCPVKIPISHLLRRQREWSFLQKTIAPQKQRWLKYFRRASQSPKKFRHASHAVRRMLRFYNRHGMIKNIGLFPPARPWFAKKNLPSPAKKSFFDKVK